MSPQGSAGQLEELVVRAIGEQGPQFNGVLMQQESHAPPAPGVNLADPEIIADGAHMQHPNDGEAATAQAERASLVNVSRFASPEKTADVRRRTRKRHKMSEALIVRRSQLLSRFGEVSSDFEDRFGSISPADLPDDSPQSTTLVDSLTFEEAATSAALESAVQDVASQAAVQQPILHETEGGTHELECIVTEADAADTDTLANTEWVEPPSDAEEQTSSQHSIEMAQAFERSALEAAAASSDAEVDQIAAVLAAEPDHNTILAEQLSREMIAEKRQADELNLALLLSQAEEIKMQATRAAEKRQLDEATAASLWSYKQAFERITTAAFWATQNDADAAVDVMLEAGVPTEAFHAFELTLEAFGTIAPPTPESSHLPAAIEHTSDSPAEARTDSSNPESELTSSSIALLARERDAVRDIIPTAR